MAGGGKFYIIGEWWMIIIRPHAAFFARFAIVQDLFLDISISDYLDGKEPWPVGCPISSWRAVSPRAVKSPPFSIFYPR
jgi:hypothetical protein